MPAKINRSTHSPSRIDTLIGADMRIAGDVACDGVVHVQGEILGDVSCEDNPNGALVVDSAGSVTGKVNAPHIVVKGKVIGPAQSSQVIEVHQGGTLVGDVSVKEIAIHAGGVVEGLLTFPVLRPDGALAQGARQEKLAAAAASSSSMAHAGAKAGLRRASIVIVLAIAAATAVWMGRHDAATNPPANTAELKSIDPSPDAADQQPAVAGGAGLAGDPRVRDGRVASLAQTPPEGARIPAQESVHEHAAATDGNVVTVGGANPSRPPGVFLLITNEPAVLYRKKLGHSAEGSRIAIAAGERVSVSIAQDEIIRVAKGKDIVILFQGQKVSQRTIESGAWIRFVAR